MKKVIIFSYLILSLLTVGCSGATKPDTSEDDLLYPTGTHWQANGSYSSFVETENGAYYQSADKIYFIPFGSDVSYPLCAKPNCAHNDENCNAYCGIGFGYYNGALYYVNRTKDNGALELLKMDMDGGNHAVVSQLGFATGLQLFFHKNTMFMILWGRNNTLPENEIDGLIAVNLSDYSQTELFSDYFAEGNRMVLRHIFKDKIYGYSDSYTGSAADCHLMEWDVTTGNVRMLNEAMITSGYATETTYLYVESGMGFREINLKTGEILPRGEPMEDAWWMSADEEFIYVVGFGRSNGTEHTLSFYSHDYELLDQVEMKNDIYYGYVSSDRLYFVNNADEVYCPIAYYIDKADIGSGRLELKPFND